MSRLSTCPSGADPDGDELVFSWWIYKETGTYGGNVAVSHSDNKRTNLKIPVDAGGKEIHLILEVKDKGAGADYFSKYRSCGGDD